MKALSPDWHVPFTRNSIVYIDHILYPTMTEAAYYTEVHNINGDGENAGVVYCEMQVRSRFVKAIVKRKRRELEYHVNAHVSFAVTITT